MCIGIISFDFCYLPGVRQLHKCSCCLVRLQRTLDLLHKRRRQILHIVLVERSPLQHSNLRQASEVLDIHLRQRDPLQELGILETNCQDPKQCNDAPHKDAFLNMQVFSLLVLPRSAERLFFKTNYCRTKFVLPQTFC